MLGTPIERFYNALLYILWDKKRQQIENTFVVNTLTSKQIWLCCHDHSTLAVIIYFLVKNTNENPSTAVFALPSFSSIFLLPLEFGGLLDGLLLLLALLKGASDGDFLLIVLAAVLDLSFNFHLDFILKKLLGVPAVVDLRTNDLALEGGLVLKRLLGNINLSRGKGINNATLLLS